MVLASMELMILIEAFFSNIELFDLSQLLVYFQILMVMLQIPPYLQP